MSSAFLSTLLLARRRVLCILLLCVAGVPTCSHAQLAGNDAAHVVAASKEGQPQADVGGGFYRNPVIAGNYADTAVVRVGADYYLTNCCEDPRGLLVWHSRDLVNWAPYSTIPLAVTGTVWAPELTYFNGLYHLYLPMMAPGTGTVWVMTAQSMKGPWSKPIDLRVGGIDPGVIRTPEGHMFLYVDAGRVVPLTDDGLATVGSLTKVYDGWKYPADWPVQCFCLESPKLLFHGGYYYLVSAQGGTDGPSTSHMAAVARSKSPTGPWEDSPYNPLVHTVDRSERWWSQGHGVLIDDVQGAWWMLFHSVENGYQSLGRQTLLLPIEWTADGWPRIRNGAAAEKTLPKPAGANVGAGMPLSDDFKDSKLSLQWNYANLASGADAKVGGGKLTLVAHGDTPSTAAQLHVQPVNHAYDATVLVSTEGKTTAGIAWTEAEQTRMTGVFLAEGNLVMFVDGHQQLTVPWMEGKVCLRLLDDQHDLSMFYSKDGKAWTRFDFGVAYDGRSAVRITLAAFGSGRGTFRQFQYQGREGGIPH